MVCSLMWRNFEGVFPGWMSVGVWRQGDQSQQTEPLGVDYSSLKETLNIAHSSGHLNILSSVLVPSCFSGLKILSHTSYILQQCCIWQVLLKLFEQWGRWWIFELAASGMMETVYTWTTSEWEWCTYWHHILFPGRHRKGCLTGLGRKGD